MKEDFDMFILIVLCLALAAAFIAVEHQKKYVPAVVLKGLASACFVALGIVTSIICGDARIAKLVVIGLLLGAVADVLLNLRFVFDEKIGSKVFLVGILVFLSGHIFYLAALIPHCPNVWLFIAVGIVLTAITMVWIFKQITAKKAFKIFGVFYIGAIVIMTCVAFGALIGNGETGHLMFFIGAVLFLISDIVLILNTFGSTTKFSLRITNLSLYYLGQLTIALSLLFI